MLHFSTFRRGEGEGVPKLFTESTVEEATLEWLAELGYEIRGGVELLESGERDSSTIVLQDRLVLAIQRINPDLPSAAIDEATRKLANVDAVLPIDRNHRFHDALANGVDVEYRRDDGTIGYDKVWLADFDNVHKNEFLAVNQYPVVEDHHNRRPDVILFINGLPIGVIELKVGDADVEDAFEQIQTYKLDIPSLFDSNELLVIGDESVARVGSLSADWERFMPWRTIAGERDMPKGMTQLEVLIRGVFDQERLLDLLRHFIVFEDDGKEKIKKVAGYHQFHAVRTAVESTIEASRVQGDRRAGVVWHTQGSGKSLTMAFYAGRLILEPAMENPTILVLTDRNDLDDQLFGTFSRCHELLRQPPTQAQDREHIRELLRVASGGVVFTTIQKFMPSEKGDPYPMLSERRNIVVIADEAHRSQYDFIDGFARHMRDAVPNATFIGFTGTPIERTDANTRAVFGDYISVYDIQRAVEDKATVPIYYESRLAKLQLDESEKPKVDSEFEEATEGEEVEHKEKLKSKWAALEAIVGTERRLGLIAADLVKHWGIRVGTIEGKGMIVCMSRRVCVDLYNEIVKLRPEWAEDALKVVMTGSAADGAEWQQHIRSKTRREELAKRFKNPEDPFRLVIVRDMWLTGFDAPSLHTMYLDKPMSGHNLMQAIARVNRVFRDKPGGLVVDYLGIADNLRRALATYTDSGGEGEGAVDQEEAVREMLRRYEIVRDLFHRFDWSAWTTGGATKQMSLIKLASDFILEQEDGKNRLDEAVSNLSKAFALSVPHERAMEIRDDVGFFQSVRAALTKTDREGRKSHKQLDYAIRQIVSGAVVSEEVVDIFAAAGLKRPDISILSDDFLAEVRDMPQKNLALELLKKLLNDDIKRRAKKNLVQSRSFLEMLEKALRQYQNRALETAQIIEELIELAKEMRARDARGEALGLTEDEVAFYDALETNDSAVAVLGEPTLRDIARELVETVKKNVTIDWTVRENVQANLRRLVKRILKKYGYPPDKQERATELVLEQAALHAEEWAA